MARRTRNTENTPAEAPAEEATNEVQEDTVSTTTEAPVADEASTEASTPEVEVDLAAFQTAAKTAVEGGDPSTGEIAAGVLEPVLKEYRALDGVKAKNAAKNWLGEQMRTEMGNDRIQTARSYLQLTDSMKGGSTGGSKEKTPADPTEAFVQSDATLRLALALHEAGEGVSEDAGDKVEALVAESEGPAREYLAWIKNTDEDKGDEPEASAVIKNAVKLAVGKAAKAGGRTSTGGTYTGERRDVAKHIVSAFDGVEEGTFLTVADIKKHTSEEYGTDSPSPGAISARLFPPSGGDCTVAGITPGQNDKGVKGAQKD